MDFREKIDILIRDFEETKESSSCRFQMSEIEAQEPENVAFIIEANEKLNGRAKIRFRWCELCFSKDHNKPVHIEIYS